MLGSSVEAEDVVQETMLRAWNKREQFEGHASLKTWLYKIATNICLDILRQAKRREIPTSFQPAGQPCDALVVYPEDIWIDPVPDAKLLSKTNTPEETSMIRQSIRLAFVQTLQCLPARQRATLLLVDVLGCSAQEVAQILETTPASVNSALQRARKTMANHPPTSPQPINSVLVERFVDAFHRFDVDEIITLLADDVRFSMPPFRLWIQGREAVRAWLFGRGAQCKDSILVPVATSGGFGFAHYKPSTDGHQPWGIAVIETCIKQRHVESWTTFLDVETLFPVFGLPKKIEQTDDSRCAQSSKILEGKHVEN